MTPGSPALQNSPTAARRVLYALSALLFVTLILAPTADRFLKFAPRTLVAESTLNKIAMPTQDPATWIKWFNAVRRGYLERHYNLRTLLITWNSFMDTFADNMNRSRGAT